MSTSTRTAAFTLIELLIVIVVIGALAGIGLVTYPGAQKTARDAQRKNDIKQYQTSLEVYANRTNGLYPNYVTPTGTATLCVDLNISGTCVDDPKGVNHYLYIANAANTQYVLYATLERQEGGVNQYWLVCSIGSSGRISTAAWTPSATCPAGLTP